MLKRLWFAVTVGWIVMAFYAIPSNPDPPPGWAEEQLRFVLMPPAMFAGVVVTVRYVIRYVITGSVR